MNENPRLPLLLSAVIFSLLPGSGLAFDADPAVPASAWDGQGPTPAYVGQTWPTTRTLVWAEPGKGGSLSDASNWLEDGKLAASPPDQDTDVVLPAATRRYTVRAEREKVRHVLIERNAELIGNHRAETEIWGNCRVRDGGWAMYVAVRGSRHSFFRMDNTAYPGKEPADGYRGPKSHGGRGNRTQLAHKLQVCKYGTASVEFIGKFGVSDEIMVQHGRMIVNGEFRWSASTQKGALEIYDGATLELRSGARICPFHPENRKKVYNINVYRNGVLQAGSPERPLTGDAFVHLGFGDNTEAGQTGLYAALGSMIRVHTTDPKTARLVFTSSTALPEEGDAASEKAAGERGTAVQLAGDVVMNGVHLDYICEGGLALADHVDPKTWSNVTFGPHNAGPAHVILGRLTVDPNVYYHDRVDARSEYGLTAAAVRSMESYLNQLDPFQIEILPANTESAEGKLVPRPVAVVFRKPVKVTIRTRVEGARVRYTTDGSEPDKDAPLYTAPFELDRTTKLAVRAFKPGLGFSSTHTTAYVVEAGL